MSAGIGLRAVGLLRDNAWEGLGSIKCVSGTLASGTECVAAQGEGAMAIPDHPIVSLSSPLPTLQNKGSHEGLILSNA